MEPLISKVKGFEGTCSPTWLNTNQILNRLDQGVTGFFKLVKPSFFGLRKTGKEFHGIINQDGIVETTEGKLN